MAKPSITKQSHSITDDDGGFSGNFLIDGAASDADGDTVTVANVDGQYVAGLIGGGKGSNVIVGAFGVLTIEQDGSYTYVLNEGLNLGAGDSILEDFQIKVRDGTGNYSSTTLKFEILGTGNDAPIAVDDHYTVAGVSAVGNVLDNDSDPDGDALHVGGVVVNGVNYHITGEGNTSIEGIYGTLVINDTGAFTYLLDTSDEDTIAVGGHGVETFAYKPHDGQNGEGNNSDYAIVEITF
jgi:VCBS repeat-containing protein